MIELIRPWVVQRFARRAAAANCKVVLLSAWVVACGGEDSRGSYATDATTSVDERSAASTLVATLAVRVAAGGDPALEPYVGMFIDYRQIESVALGVDGQSWGRFRGADAGDALAEGGVVAGAWTLHERPSSALIAAEIGADIDSEQNPPDTAGAWVELLARFVSPGGHVVSVDLVRLAPAEGEVVELRPRALSPFEVADGASSAFVGSLELGFDGAGVAP